MNIGMKKQTSMTYERALEEVPEALKREGFGVLTRIDLKETLKAKLGVDFRRYMVLGACNPPIAHQALSHELGFGVLIPCNVVVYEGDDGKAVVTAVDPVQTIAASGDATMQGLVKDIRARLARVLEQLK
jgi:uncharacterized protein (DUF302 family)